MPTEDSKSSPLEEWIKENAEDITLQQLAFSSGVHYDSLRLIADGDALPDWSHIQALRRIIPSLPTNLLEAHRVASPAAIKTGRGSVPPGSKFMIIPVSEIQVGDYIAYIPAAKSLRGKAHWVQVNSIRLSDRVARVDFYDLQISNVLNPIKLTGMNPVRVARINASDTDHARIEPD